MKKGFSSRKHGRERAKVSERERVKKMINHFYLHHYTELHYRQSGSKRAARQQSTFYLMMMKILPLAVFDDRK
jgi:hypothetical protein